MYAPLWIVDAFTDHPFAGNPAAVCLLSAPRPDRWMQASARGGVVGVRLRDDRLHLPGRAATGLRGELVV